MIKKHTISIVIAIVFAIALPTHAQTEVKFNMATATLLIPNVGIEIPITNHSSVQLDVLGAFWDSFNGEPLQIVQVFPEYRYYLKPERSGLFVGGHIGFGMFTMQKPGFLVLYDKYTPNSPYNLKHEDGSFQSGRATFYGLTLGYKHRLNERWGLELFVGGGLSQTNYKGFNRLDRVDVDEDNYRDFNGSGEVLLYRGGLMLVYKLKGVSK